MARLDCDEILPGRLWVGGFVSEADVAELEQMGITAVVNLQTDEDMRQFGIDPPRLARAYARAGIDLLRAPTPDFDREALARSLPDAVAKVQSALARPDARLYLHCTAGVNRSATTAAAFLIVRHGLSPEAAREFLTSRRNCNPPLEILEDFEIMMRLPGTDSE